MFDIGFAELLVIAVVGLLVLGPDRLPEATRTGVLWLGRLRRSLTRARETISRELNTDEIRQQLYNEDILRELRERAHSTDTTFPEPPIAPSPESGPEPSRADQRDG
ncbi:MAG: Sec-independent protein translocase protein TatB [Pseudomonadota bacterium]|nr:Sec-independent protein translocase protein TatB [Pseudomonadota bacterium]